MRRLYRSTCCSEPSRSPLRSSFSSLRAASECNASWRRFAGFSQWESVQPCSAHLELKRCIPPSYIFQQLRTLPRSRLPNMCPCPPGMLWSAKQQLPCLLSKFLAARVFSHEFGDIINEAMYGHPNIPITLVLRKLLVAYGMHCPTAALHLSLYLASYWCSQAQLRPLQKT